MAHGPPIHDSDEISGRHLDWDLFRRFLGYLSPYRRSALGALLVMPVAAAAKLAQPYLLKIGIDDYIMAGELDGLGWIALLFVLLLFGESLLTFAQTYLVQLVGQRIMADLRGAGFRRLLRLPARFFDRNPSGRLVTRLTSDIENVGELFGSGVVAALGDILTLVAIVGVMLWLDATLSLVAFAVLPPLLLMLLLFRVYIRRANRQVRARLATLNAFIAERIAGASEVRLFGQEQRTLDEFEALQQDYRRSTFTVINWDATLYAVVEALGSVAIAAILWKGGGEIIAGTASFGTLVAFIEYVQKFFAPLRDLSAKYSVIQASNASLERIFDLLDRDPEPAGEKPRRAGRGEVRLEGVDFSYEAGSPVLQGVDLYVAPGQNVALVGDTGSGKTTIARLLLSFYQPTAGRILLDGQDLTRIDPREVRRRVGWISQEPFLFDGTVRENIDPEGLLDEGGCAEVLRRSGALATVRRLGGLTAHIAERGKNLSAGERQLLCLARALASDPELLIMDEATSRLDAETEEQVRRGAEEARRGRSALLIAHRLRSIRHADRIVVLRRGQVREEGTHRELMARNGLYARLWRLQALEGKEAKRAGKTAEAAQMEQN